MYKLYLPTAGPGHSRAALRMQMYLKLNSTLAKHGLILPKLRPGEDLQSLI